MLKKYFSPVALALSIFVLLYTFYRSKIYYKGTFDEYYDIYYKISYILIFFSIISFYISEKIKTYFLICSLSVLLTAYSFEFYYTYINGFFSFNTDSKLEFYKNKKKEDKTSVVTVYPHQYYAKDNIDYLFGSETKINIFPLSGVSNSLTIQCNENGYFSNWKSDRYGFRNPDSEWDRADENIEYMMVGDSFTQGACVNDPNDFGSQLRILNNQKKILNLGYGGNGPLLEYATMREYITPNVKNIIWFYCEHSDLWNLNDELKSIFLNQYLTNKNFKQNLKDRQKDIDTLAKKLMLKSINSDDKSQITWKQTLFKLYNVRSIITRILKKNQNDPFEKNLIKFQKPRNEFYEILIAAKELAEKNGADFYFVYLPEYQRYRYKYDDTNRNIITEELKRLKINLIDIHKEFFQKVSKPLSYFPFERKGHYNVHGYQKISKIINNKVQNN